MAARKMATRSGQKLGSSHPATSLFEKPSPDAESVAARLALVAGTSPGAFYLVAAIIEGILSVVPEIRTDQKVH